MAFFFSAVSAEEGKQSKSRRKEEEDTESDSEDEFLHSSENCSQTLAVHTTVIKKHLRPTITYWIAMTTPNGAPANPLVILKVLLECNVEASARQVIIYCDLNNERFEHKYSFIHLLTNPFYRCLSKMESNQQL